MAEHAGTDHAVVADVNQLGRDLDHRARARAAGVVGIELADVQGEIVIAGDAAAVPADVAVQDDGEFLETASLNESIRAAVAALEPGGVSPPVEIGDARYLVQLVAREPARVRPLEEVSGELEKQLRAAEFERLNQTWIDALRAKYYVQTFDHALFDRERP